MAVRKFKPFTPYGTPPADRYDPALDAQVAAGERGLGDYVTDAGIGNRRDLENYGFGVHDAQLGQTRGHEDIGDQRFDVNRGYERTGEDYNRQVSLLQRSYRQLAGSQ